MVLDKKFDRFDNSKFFSTNQNKLAYHMLPVVPPRADGSPFQPKFRFDLILLFLLDLDNEVYSLFSTIWLPRGKKY